jgi:hypothetical protein
MIAGAPSQAPPAAPEDSDSESLSAPTAETLPGMVTYSVGLRGSAASVGPGPPGLSLS